MKLNKENSKQIRNSTTPFLSNIILNNSGLIPNKVAYRKIPSNQTNHQKIDRGSVTLATLSKLKNGYTPSKVVIENTRYNQTPSIKESSKATKITKKIVRTEPPKTQTHTEKKVVKTVTNNTTTNFNPNPNINKIINSIRTSINKINISNYNSNNDPILKNNNSFNSSYRGSYKEIQKNFSPPKNDSTINSLNFNTSNINNSITNNSIKPAKNIMRYSSTGNFKNLNHIYKNNISINNNTYTNNYLNKKARYSTMASSLPKKIITQNEPENTIIKLSTINTSSIINRSSVSGMNHKRKALSPSVNDLRRKTINRGDPIENVQITHIIYTSQPANFNITEELNTQSLNSEPMKISQIERKNLKKRGKTTWTSSVQDNIKPIITNLKGTTTVYQHARGIGMTNDKKENINPLYYSSKIRKLYPIVKKRQKEKVEYMSFRNESGFNSERATYNNNINFSNPSYNFIKIYNDENCKNNSLRNSMNYNRVINNSNIENNNNNNKSEISKENFSKIFMGTRSQFRKQGKPVINMNNERKLYNSNVFYRK